MKIVIFGAGALGAYYGGRLLESGRDAVFFVREKRAEKLKRFGLAIHSPNGDAAFTEFPFAVRTEEIGKADLVLLAVKGYHLRDTLPALKELVKKGGKVLPILNGVEHYEVLQKELGKENVLGGLSYIMASLDERGHVIHANAQDTLLFGPLAPSQEDFCAQVEDLFRPTSFTAIKTDAIETAIWEKYMFITAFSGVTSAADLPIGIIRSHPETLEIARQIVKEMKQLANLYQVPLTEEQVEKTEQIFQALPEEGTSSMHRDKKKGLPLELDHLHGAALRMAERKKAKLPYIQFIYQLLKPYEKGLKPSETAAP